MISIVNQERRVMIFGDGFRKSYTDPDGTVRRDKKPGESTRLNPGQSITLDEVPEERRERFLAAVRRQIAKGYKLLVVDGEAPAQGADAEALRRQKNLDELDRLTVESVDSEPVKRGRGRPRKTPPLGG